MSIALSTITCTSGQVYAKFSKKCGTSWANEESFEVWGGGVKLQTSPTFENNELRVLEYCLTATTNSQYQVKMIDSYGDSWTSGSWLMVEGINGNRVFKNFLAASREEEYTISLYSGVNKNDQWRLTSGTVSGSWTEYNYGDSSWAQVTLGSVTTEVSGPQYFRKTFTGLANMAAYELSMNYRYGIVAYVNGNEVYRDNMPDGVPTPSTFASGSYTTVEYHAVIRAGAEVSNSQSVLAIELHFLSAQSSQTFVDFNAYLSILASDVTDDSCFIYPYDVSISSTGGSSSSYILDYSRSTSFSSSASSLPVSVTYTLTGPKAYANGVRVWPYSSPTSAPRDFVWQGANSASATSWTNIITKTGATYTTLTYKVFNGYFNAGLFSNYKLTINAVASTYLYAYEIQPVICSIGIPQSIVYETTPYTFYARFEQVFVQSRITEFTNCVINPTPAEGLTFDQSTCVLSGFVNSAMTTTYTVTSTMNGQQYTGSFTLQINECAGTLVNILRSYKYNAVYEGFSIADSANPSNPILTVATNSGQSNNQDVNNILCLTGTKYILTTTSTLNYWYSNSYVYVNAILGGITDYETIIRARFDNYLGLETSHSFNVQYAISPVSQWYYKMNEVPSNWYGSDTSGWATGSAGSFTGVTNQIQLYKKEFTVTSLNNVAGIVVSLKYQYGVIIYLNNHEVFRKGVTGDLSTSSFSSTSLADANFRQISLPIKTMGDGETSSVDYITTGTNRIAIALVAAGPAQTTAYFDCAVRLMGEAEVSRTYDYASTYSLVYGYPTTILNHYYSQYIYYSTCANNYIQITFNDDRHEWISSISIQLYYTQSTQQVRQFVLKAKNAEDTEWTTLKTVTGMTWSLAGQKNKIWIVNNKAWNQYRFENFGTGSTTECYWKLGDIDMMSNAIQNEIPALAYAPTSIYKNIEMGEVYPNSNYYYDFTVTPNLPTGINLDPHTGTISGTAHDTTMSTTYTIGAKKVTGESVTAQFQFGVEVCTGGKSLITLVARSDTYPQESSYKVYQGKGMSGQVVAQVDRLRAYSALNYGDFCLNHGIYTLELKDATTGWATGSSGSFTGVTNQIQLYKKEFTVTSLNNVAGIVVSLKYQYGVIIYLNNHEVFRKGVTGDLSTSSFSSTSLADANFRQISLPIKTMGDGETSSVDYITTGTNRIAIALVAAGPAQTTAYFDCAVRLMGEAEVSRTYDYASTYSLVYGYPTTILNHYYSQYIYYSTCANNYIQITFNDDRHEWISSISIQLYYTQSTQQVRQFVLKAKNAEDTEWTTLKTVTGMTWSLAGQKNKIWIVNNKAWNQYRFENFGTGSTTECYWKLGDIDMMSNAIQNEIPALAYAPTSIYKNIEMGEVYPNSNYYYDFTVTPNLPTGINLDPHTGTISGTAHDTTMSTTYTIGAKKVTGESVTAQFQFGVEVCTGGKSLITLVARSDTYPQESSYKVYQGKGMSGQVVAQVDRLRAYSALNYGDFCLNHGIYTLELKDATTGWNNPGGYYLTVDVGEMKFEMGQVYTTTSPASVTTMFSSFLPFQIEYDDWKVNKDGDVANNWNAVDYDDSTWTVTKAANIGTSEATTVYIRRDINFDNSADYQVLNVRVKYAGGVVAYFNGRKVARFNLEENFDSTSLSLAVHDENSFSKFHIVLPTVGITNGKNVIAFEIHRPIGQSSSQPVVFDATGVFGVNDCSIGVDSYIDIDGSTGYVIGNLENFFDLTPVTYGYQSNVDGTFLSWSVENLEGTKFNSFALQTVYERTSWGFSLYARDNEEEDFTSIFEGLDLATVTRARAAWPVPVGIAGYRHYKWEVDDPATSTVYISAYIFQYCKASGTGVCEGEGDYPPVAEGQISPGECDEGFRGYSYRECTNGQLGPVKKEKCFHKLPGKLSYDSDRYTLVMNTQVNIAAPTYLNIIEKFYLSENTFLPDGLTLDTVTGAITGVPTTEMELKQFTIYGENPTGVTSTTINLSVRKGECKADGNFPKTQVGEIAQYDCSLAGSYVGTQKRACLLGNKDGEWQKIQGVCMPISMIVLLVIVVIIVIAVVIFFISRTRKTKAVGGVKGKKSSKNSGSKKALEKKGSNKAIKV